MEGQRMRAQHHDSSPDDATCGAGDAKRRTRQPPTLCTAFAKTSADALLLIASSLGWSVLTSERDDSDVYWVVSELHAQQRLHKLRAGQTLSRIPGMHGAARKCSFSRVMTLASRLFPGQFDFYPQTWTLPDDMSRMQLALKDWETKSMPRDGKHEWKRNAVIVKPDDGSQGDGIHICTSYEELMVRTKAANGSTHSGDMVVQTYLARPMLLDGFKFDLRVYVLIRSLEPLEVWVCREGLARFCTERYRAPTSKNCSQVMGHLTNFSLNKRSQAFVSCKDAASIESIYANLDSRDVYEAVPDDRQRESSKKTLTYVLRQLRAEGVDTEMVWREITGVVEKTCIVLQPFLKQTTQDWVWSKAGVDESEEVSALAGSCFHLVGFDIMLDNVGHCHLLEINCSPRLGVDGIELVDSKNPPENAAICRCSDDPKPHVHYLCEIDRYVKSLALGGALLLLTTWRQRTGVCDIRPELEKRLAGIYDRVIQSAGIVRPIDGGDFGLLARVQELYASVVGRHRKMTLSRLRAMMKSMGLDSQAGLSLVEMLHQKMKARYKRPVDLEIFFEILERIAAEAFPPALFADVTPFLALDQLVQMAGVGRGGLPGGGADRTSVQSPMSITTDHSSVVNRQGEEKHACSTVGHGDGGCWRLDLCRGLGPLVLSGEASEASPLARRERGKSRDPPSALSKEGHDKVAATGRSVGRALSSPGPCERKQHAGKPVAVRKEKETRNVFPIRGPVTRHAGGSGGSSGRNTPSWAKTAHSPAALAPKSSLASGLKWLNLGPCLPDGNRLTNAKLAAALERQSTFTKAEWNDFGITDLRCDQFVLVGNSAFRPAAPAKAPRASEIFQQASKKAASAAVAEGRASPLWLASPGEAGRLCIAVNQAHQAPGPKIGKVSAVVANLPSAVVAVSRARSVAP